MTVLTERLPHTGGFLITEGQGDISREAVTLLKRSETYRSGEVLGQVTISRKYTGYDNAAADGTQTAAGVLWDDVDATAADAAGVAIVRLATVNTAELVFDDGQNDAAKTAACTDLAALTIIAR